MLVIVEIIVHEDSRGRVIACEIDLVEEKHFRRIEDVVGNCGGKQELGKRACFWDNRIEQEGIDTAMC